MTAFVLSLFGLTCMYVCLSLMCAHADDETAAQRGPLCDAGAIPPLLLMLRESDTQQQELAALALSLLSNGCTYCAYTYTRHMSPSFSFLSLYGPV